MTNDPLAGLQIGTGTLARLLGLSRQRISQLVTAGVLVKLGRGQFDVETSVRAYLKFREQSAEGPAGISDLGTQRVRLLKLKADLAAMDLGRTRGELVPIADVAAKVSGEYAVVRNRFMALPSTCAPRVAGLEAKAAFAVLHAEVVTILRELSADAAIALKAQAKTSEAQK